MSLRQSGLWKRSGRPGASILPEKINATDQEGLRSSSRSIRQGHCPAEAPGRAHVLSFQQRGVADGRRPARLSGEAVNGTVSHLHIEIVAEGPSEPTGT